MSKTNKNAPINRNVRAIPKVEDKKPTTKSQKPSKTSTTSTTTKVLTKIEKTAKIKTEDAKNLEKPVKSIKSKVTAEVKQKQIVKNPIRLKPTTTATTTTTKQKTKPEIKTQPLRAKYTPEILKNIKETNSHTNVSKTNVMNTVHNVTVLSPPTNRKGIPPSKKSNSIEEKPVEQKLIRERTRTRTLEPEEIVVLKNNSKTGPKSLDDTILSNKISGNISSKHVDDINEKVQEKGHNKEPVTFEIKFDGKQEKTSNKKTREDLKTKSKEPNNLGITQPDEGEYEDDFESYESDFETGSSSSSVGQSEVGHSPITTTTTSNEENHNNPTLNNSDTESTDEESEETQPEVTIIKRDKEDERKLDSGNYDLNIRKEKLQQQNLGPIVQQQFDSLDTITINSDQLDSGISYGVNTTTHSGRSSAGLVNITKSSKISKRGRELMEKIQLDTIGFVLFELKPIKYEHYMKIYGNLNARQMATQTNDNRNDTECQTDEYQQRSIWTQHPPQYDLKFVQENNFVNFRNACGEFSDDDDDDDDQYFTSTGNDRAETNGDPFAKSIKSLNKFKRNEMRRILEVQKQINFDHLNDFLNKLVPSILSVLNRSSKMKRLQNTNLSISNGFYNFNTSFLSALKVIRIFSHPQYNLLLAIHESIDDDIYRSDFMNLISVWSTNEMENPIRLLSTWSEVCRIDICAESSDIIVCGLRDGSIALWDLRETYSFCSKLDGYLKHFAATQSIAPILYGDDSMTLRDLGAVIDIKSFKMASKLFKIKAYKQTQFVSLNDTGILTIWTLVETGKNDLNNSYATTIPITSDLKHTKSKIEYNSPWARVKLIQSAIYDLRDYLDLKHVRIKNKFEKTRSYFENDLFNDEVLKELADTQKQQDFKLSLQGIRFTSLDTGVEQIFIATNKNFIITCSKTLKTNRFGKIFVDESKFLFPTAIKLFTTEEYVIVGLSNGSVVALNCNQNKPMDTAEGENAIELEGKSNSSTGGNLEFDYEIGKSCTIQNIIRNERKSFESYDSSGLYEMKKTAGIEQSVDSEPNEFDYRIFDQQVLLSGSVLRKSLVQNIEISTDGRKLYALTEGNVRVYDFLLEKEINNNSMNNGIKGFGLVREPTGQQNMILFTENDDVQLHNLK